MKRLISAVIAFVALSGFAQEQPRFGEKVDVNLVLLDAVVTDTRGNQILGLDKNDFAVRENGAVQPVESVEYFTNRTLLNAPEANAPFKVERTHEARYFVLFFDRPNSGELWDRVTRARRDSMDFVRSLRDGDQVAVAGHDVRLKVYSDFTSDKTQLLHALDAVSGFPKGLTTGNGPIMKAINSSAMMNDTGTVYEALEILGDALRGIKARKNVILFSPGIYEPGQAERNGLIVSESRYYRPMIQALNTANVTVYAANLLPDASITVPAVHQTLERLTSDTNGEYWRTPVTFTSVLKRVEQRTSGYYLISYYAHHPAGTRGYQHVDVSLKNPELRVKAREGYAYGSE
jgi:VWFA-related protein